MEEPDDRTKAGAAEQLFCAIFDSEIEGARVAYEKTGNPLFVWKVLHLISAFVEGSSRSKELGTQVRFQIPPWCLDYLFEAAKSIEDLSWGFRMGPGDQPDLDVQLEPRECIDELPAAIGFVRSGWNAFNERQSIRQTRWMWKRVNELRDEGYSYEKATQIAAEYYDYNDVRSFRRRLSKYDRMYTDSSGEGHDQT